MTQQLEKQPINSHRKSKTTVFSETIFFIQEAIRNPLLSADEPFLSH